MTSAVKKIYIYSIITFVIWSVMLMASFLWDLRLVHKESQNIARNIADSNFNKDQALRLWIAKQGGIYVAVSNSVQPNPNLAHLEDRDISTPLGKPLTLMNPAYVLRMVSEEYNSMFDIKNRLTSLKPIREGNAPDDWERAALLKLEKGVAEVNGVVSIDGRNYYRVIRPMLTKQECLKCHAHQGYVLGDVRGGLSVTVPLEPLDKIQSQHVVGLIITSFAGWLIGLGVIVIITKKMKALFIEHIKLEEDLLRHHRQLEGLVSERTEELRIKSEALEEKNNALNIKIAQEEAAQRSLAQAYGFVRSIFNSMKDPIAIIDVRDFTIVDANSVFLQEYGLENRSEAIGRTCYEITHHKAERCDSSETCPLFETVEKGVSSEVVHEHIDSHGKPLYHEIHSTPIFDEDGKVTQVIHVSRDITQRRLSEIALRESKERFRHFIDASRDAIVWVDIDDRISLINNSGAAMFGYATPLAMMGIQIKGTLIDESHWDILSGTLEKEHSIMSFQCVAHKADDAVLFIEVSASTIFDTDGEVLGIEAIIRDITEKHKMEDDLRMRQQALEETNRTLSVLVDTIIAAKKEWESTFDAIEDMIVLLNDDGRIKRCNTAFVKFTKRSYDDLVGAEFPGIMDELGFEYESHTDYGVELHDRNAKKWYSLRMHENIITIHDQTEIKSIAEALEVTNESVEKNRRGLENALDELSFLIQKVTTTKDFSVRFTNPQLPTCYEVMKCTKTECPLHGTKASRCWQTAGTFCGGKVNGKFAEKIGNCMQCPVFEFATSDPIYQIGENFNNMMHILEIQHTELEVAYNDLKLAQMQVTQQEKMASIGQLAAGVAHEINNPTGFIMSNLGSLKRYIDKITEMMRLYSESARYLPEDVASSLEERSKALKLGFILDDIGGLVSESIEGTERIKKIVQDLKDFSRVDEAEHKLADINAGIESTLNIVWNELKYKATVKKEYGDIPPIVCNPGQLNQVFMNLLVNAAQAIETKGEIGIKTWQDDGNIFVSISDTGSGIPKDKINRIFEPFFTTKEVGKGTGLGLSITYDIIKKHHGEILVESEVGIGTTFTIRIPIRETASG